MYENIKQIQTKQYEKLLPTPFYYDSYINFHNM